MQIVIKLTSNNVILPVIYDYYAAVGFQQKDVCIHTFFAFLKEDALILTSSAESSLQKKNVQ